MLGASANPSTSTLASLASTATITSTAPLQTHQTEKDYFATFAAMQISYGFGGVAPTRPELPKSKKREEPKATSSLSSPSPSPSPSPSSPLQRQPKSQSDALAPSDKTFGDFAAVYGFAGTAPTIPAVPPATPISISKTLKFWRRKT